MFKQIPEGHRRQPYTTLGRKTDPSHSIPAECFWLCADCVTQCSDGYCHKAKVEDKILWNDGNFFFCGKDNSRGRKKCLQVIYFLYLQIMFYYLEEAMNHKKCDFPPTLLKSQYEFNKNKITF